MEFEQKHATIPASIRDRIVKIFAKDNERKLAFDVMSHVIGSGGQAKIRLMDFDDMGGVYHLGSVRSRRIAEDLLEHDFLQYRTSGWRGGGRLFLLHPDLPLTGAIYTTYNQEPEAQEELPMTSSNPYADAIATIRNFTTLSPVEAMPTNMAKGVLLDVIEVVGGVLGADAVMNVLAELDRPSKEVAITLAPEVPA